jgi:hypothetical protein
LGGQGETSSNFLLVSQSAIVSTQTKTLPAI